MQRILILGASGYIGNVVTMEIKKNDQFDVYGTYYQGAIPLDESKRFKLNMEDTNNIDSILNIVEPHIVISCIRGDYDKQLILHKKVAEYLRQNEGKLYFCSTTNVFDNDFSKPHAEDEKPNARTEYGQFKIECENLVSKLLGQNAVILRLPAIWGKDSPRMKQLLQTLNNHEKVVVYPGLFMSYHVDTELAKQIAHIVEHDLRGVFHLVAKSVVNHKDFYLNLIEALGYLDITIEESKEIEGYFALFSKNKHHFQDEANLINNKELVELIINK